METILERLIRLSRPISRISFLLLLVVFILIVGFGRRQDFYQDQSSHSVKYRDSWTGHEEIVFKTREYNPRSANWEKGVLLGISTPILNGDVLLIKIANIIYAVQFIDQSITPEVLTYKCWKLGDKSSTFQRSGKKIDVGGIEIDWSCLSSGKGTINMDQFFIPGVAARFEVGVPFFRLKGNSDLDRNAIDSVRFEVQPWKI